MRWAPRLRMLTMSHESISRLAIVLQLTPSSSCNTASQMAISSPMTRRELLLRNSQSDFEAFFTTLSNNGVTIAESIYRSLRLKVGTINHEPVLLTPSLRSGRPPGPGRPDKYLCEDVHRAGRCDG